jgi:hypothetical protein
MSALDKGLILHIGLHKTGTETIQKTLFSGHPEIYYIGKYVQNNILRGCLSQEIYDFMNPLIWNISQPLDLDRYRGVLQEQIVPGIDPGKFLVGSWEGLGNSPVNEYVEKIKRLQSIFGSCRVMMTIRNPLTQIPSYYLQNIRGHFLYRNRPWMGNLPYIDIDEWLKRKISKNLTLEEVFPYSRNIQAAVNLLGKENVGVFVFEELINDPDRYYGTICDFIGIDVTQGLKLTRQRHLHKRTTQGQVEYLQRLSNSTWYKLILKFKGSQSRRRLIDANAGDGVHAKVSLPSQWERRISDATRAGNRWIAMNYHLYLEKYDYPL